MVVKRLSQIKTALPATGSSRVTLASNPQAAEVETVNSAWKHVKAVVVNDGKVADLCDLLSSSKDIIDPMPIGVRLGLLLSHIISFQTSLNLSVLVLFPAEAKVQCAEWHTS